MYPTTSKILIHYFNTDSTMEDRRNLGKMKLNEQGRQMEKNEEKVEPFPNFSLKDPSELFL